MCKISLKFSYEKLKIVNLCFDYLEYNLNDSKDKKALISIAQQLSIKLKKKEVTKEFEKGTFKISFHYYEAFALYKIFLEKIYVYNGIYEKNILQNYINQLDNQLQ